MEVANEAISDRGRFSISLSGAPTTTRVYQLLAGPPFADRVDWGRVHVFWGDERCVPPDDLRNNARMARLSLLDHVPVRPEHVHPIVCVSSAKDGALSYQTLLRSFFYREKPSFDLVFWGWEQMAIRLLFSLERRVCLPPFYYRYPAPGSCQNACPILKWN